MEKTILKNKRQTAMMNTTIISKKLITASFTNFLIEKEITALPDNIKTTYSIICQNHLYIPNTLILEPIKQ